MTQLTCSPRVSHPLRPALLLAAAAAAVALSSSTARAQYRVGADGHYNDANSRMGSGGYNSASDASYRSSLNNQIITGNVSGLSYFHQSRSNQIGSFDPNTLQTGTQDRAFQTFSAISAPVNYAAPSTGAPAYVPYYNQQQYTAQPPPNFVRTQNNFGYVPAPQVSPETPSSDSRVPNLNGSPLDQYGTNLPAPGAANGSGPVNPVANQQAQLYAMSSLYGIRQVQPSDASEGSMFTDRFGATPQSSSVSRMDPLAIQRLRNELTNSVVENNPGNAQVPNAMGGTSVTSGINGGPSNGTAANGAQVSDQVPNGPAGGATVSSQSFGGQVGGTQAMTSPVGRPLSTVTQTLTVEPGKQSQQLAELERRFAAANPHPTAVQETARLNQERLFLRQQQAAAAHKPGTGVTPAGSVTAGGGGGGTAPTFNTSKFGGASPVTGAPAGRRPDVGTSVTTTPDLAPVVREHDAVGGGASDQPFVITSLVTGIRAKGLADLMQSAEEKMRAGQFGQAVDQYDTAAEVAPNNPFVPLGRGFAELGASYYGKAESDLTRAILTEPAVLAGQYDLKGFLGENRLQFVVKDLKDIAGTEKTARPHLLLAYIAHNGGQDDATVTTQELDAAANAGGNPRLIELMREAWNLKPAAGAPPAVPAGK